MNKKRLLIRLFIGILIILATTLCGWFAFYSANHFYNKECPRYANQMVFTSEDEGFILYESSKLIVDSVLGFVHSEPKLYLYRTDDGGKHWRCCDTIKGYTAQREFDDVVAWFNHDSVYFSVSDSIREHSYILGYDRKKNSYEIRKGSGRKENNQTIANPPFQIRKEDSGMAIYYGSERVAFYKGYTSYCNLRRNGEIVVAFLCVVGPLFLDQDLIYSLDGGKTWKLKRLFEASLSPSCLTGRCLYLYTSPGTIRKIVLK